jgi:hypothetical protein
MEELLTKNIELKKKYEKLLEESKVNKTVKIPVTAYSSQLEKENGKLIELVAMLRGEIETLVKEREAYQMTHAQLKIDNQTILLENASLKEINSDLISQNRDLVKENELLAQKNN